MTLDNRLQAGTCLADRAWFGTVTVTENVRLARDTYRVRFESPQIARGIVPGQFVMVRLAGYDDPLLGRPLALYDTVLDASGEPVGIDLVYLVTGKLTGKLATFLPGQQLQVWGPLGNGFAPQTAKHLVMVAGGIGQTPFVALAREALGRRAYGSPAREISPLQRVTLCYGARTRDFLAGIDDFAAAGAAVRISTDDGTAGHHGLVTDLLRGVLSEQDDLANCRVVCCGPEPMMAAVAQMTAEFGVGCQVSLETPMACGIGICFSCVARVRDDKRGWDYRRTCVEGPVFDAQAIIFD
ncbi:MAG TPA: dihydroorotate dehydrogenase electron transfer subunit [Pirellulales bacterium]|jgi:dihydroorotate dehydrogenase electron transfer subunit|nr:dihydroorotate dehydrogenase electron transfer subunit [Pirellulales bacterium]